MFKTHAKPAIFSISFQKVKAGAAAAAHPQPAPGERSSNTWPFPACNTVLVPNVPQLRSLPQHHPSTTRPSRGGKAAQKDVPLKPSEGEALPSLNATAGVQRVLPASQCFC